ncbi:MAG: hypothetical protein JWN70_4705 [Planctomycetaceae bacterium]|nr:hypothetical protein [Planctomycetaceae bacterium]
MTTSAELERLLSLVKFDPRLSSTDGLDAFQDLLDGDEQTQTVQFLLRKLPTLEGQRAGSIAFLLANYYSRSASDLNGLRKLFATDDAEIKESVLSALSGNPGSNLKLGAGIVEMALESMHHPAPGVREQACWVIQNQSAWKMDVTGALEPLQSLLSDESRKVRRQAANAIGNLAKDKYDMSAHIAGLRQNARHTDIYVKEAAAGTLWQLSRSKHDIGAAVPELVQLLTDKDDYDLHAKNAAGALLHHAKKSETNLNQVRQAIKQVRLNSKRKEIARFLDQLAEVNSEGG